MYSGMCATEATAKQRPDQAWQLSAVPAACHHTFTHTHTTHTQGLAAVTHLMHMHSSLERGLQEQNISSQVSSGSVGEEHKVSQRHGSVGVGWQAL